MKRKLVSQSRPFRGLESLEARRLMSLTTQIVEVPISQAAITAEPSLANFKTLDLQVKLDSGERWISVDADFILTKGTFYNTPSGDGGQNSTNPGLWSIIPQLQFDTAVCGASFSRPDLLAQYIPATNNGGKFTSTETNVSWGKLQDTGTGTFTVGRFTVSKDAAGSIVGQDASTLTPAFQPKQFQFNISGGAVVQLSSISGHVFNDANANGKVDPGEGGTADWKVYLDKNNNGKFDSGEKFRLTDANGDYSFDALTKGTYYVKEIVPAGFRKTFPSASKYTSVVSSGVNGIHKDWGNTNRALLSGTIFNDKNSNGKKDSGESGLAGFTIYLDANKNNKQDSGEKTADSDSAGYWVFKSLAAGTYVVKIAPKTGYKATTSGFSIKLVAAQSATGKLFGVHKL